MVDEGGMDMWPGHCERGTWEAQPLSASAAAVEQWARASGKAPVDYHKPAGNEEQQILREQ